MHLKFYHNVPGETVEYVKSILPLIGNITEFEVYRDHEDSPYLSHEDNEERRYTFVLRDDHDNEFWLSTQCGFIGDGPNATVEILHLLGLNSNFHIREEGNHFIKQSKLRPQHRLILLVSTQRDYYENPSPQFLSFAAFPYAHQLHEARKMLQCLGHIDCNIDNDRFPKDLVNSQNFTEGPNDHEWCSYAANNLFVFSPDFRSFTNTQLKTLIKNAVEKNKGIVEFAEILGRP